jgi:hypothetical protein
MRMLVATVILLLATAAQARTLVLEQVFDGRATASGTFRNTLDGTERRISVAFHGRWDKRTSTLTLREDIAFSDGEKQRKTWLLKRIAPGTYVGTRDDVVGEARGYTDAEGRVRLRYRAKVGERPLTFDDVLELQPDGSILNRAGVSYYAIPVGTVELHIRMR